MVGYEWNPPPNNGLRHLESELSFVAGMCAASLIKKDLQLPPVTGKCGLIFGVESFELVQII